MQIYYMDNKLYINIEDRINFSLIHQLKRKLYRILTQYGIQLVEVSILNNEHFDSSLLDDFINDYNSKFQGILIVK